MKLQKHICLFLAFFVLVSNVGFAMNVHYCDNKIASVSFNPSSASAIEKDCCGTVERMSHCCKDKVIVIKKKSDQAVVKSFVFEAPQFLFPQSGLPVFNAIDFPFSTPSVPAYYCDLHAPPLFQLYSQYIFYDRF